MNLKQGTTPATPPSFTTNERSRDARVSRLGYAYREHRSRLDQPLTAPAIMLVLNLLVKKQIDDHHRVDQPLTAPAIMLVLNLLVK